MNFPAYAELPRPEGDPLPLARGVWGPDDQIGMWNNLTEEKTAAAARLVTVGRRFNLNLPLHVPLGLTGEGAHAVRKGPTPTMFEIGVGRIMGRDDKVEIYNQASTQWDGLTHVGDREHGFYNGVRPEQVTHDEGGRNGIEKVAEYGIATRAVLVDLPHHFAARGRPWHPMKSYAASAADIADCLEANDVVLGQGDVLLVRTGWLDLFMNAAPSERHGLFHDRTYSGLSGEPDMWEFLWDRRVAAVASDSVAVEAFPITAEQPSLHLAIARLGLNLGELFDLEALAACCHENGRYECFFTSMPLNLRGGVGSPANAMAML